MNISRIVNLFSLRDTPLIVFVTHNIGGGTDKHLNDLTRMFPSEAEFLLIKPVMDHLVELFLVKNPKEFRLVLSIDQQYDELVKLLSSLCVTRIHYHHLLGHSSKIMNLALDLGVPYDFTTHDYHCVCPRIHLAEKGGRYCGEFGLEQCRECLKDYYDSRGVNIETWRKDYRSFLEQAERVIAPSLDTAKRLKRYFPSLQIIPAWHPERVINREVNLRTVQSCSKNITIMVIGALSSIKGSDLLTACVNDSILRKLPVRYILLGYFLDRKSGIQANNLVIHGRYNDDRLEYWLRYYSPDIAWFPSQVPETYCYTLSAALRSGIPIVGPDFGAFPERLAEQSWSWLIPWDTKANDVNEFFLKIKLKNLSNNLQPRRVPRIGTPSFSYDENYVIKPLASSKIDAEMLCRRYKKIRKKIYVTYWIHASKKVLAQKLRKVSLLRYFVDNVSKICHGLRMRSHFL